MNLQIVMVMRLPSASLMRLLSVAVYLVPGASDAFGLRVVALQPTVAATAAPVTDFPRVNGALSMPTTCSVRLAEWQQLAQENGGPEPVCSSAGRVLTAQRAAANSCAFGGCS